MNPYSESEILVLFYHPGVSLGKDLKIVLEVSYSCTSMHMRTAVAITKKKNLSTHPLGNY